jgi:hypothetical protein
MARGGVWSFKPRGGSEALVLGFEELGELDGGAVPEVRTYDLHAYRQ